MGNMDSFRVPLGDKLTKSDFYTTLKECNKLAQAGEADKYEAYWKAVEVGAKFITIDSLFDNEFGDFEIVKYKFFADGCPWFEHASQSIVKTFDRDSIFEMKKAG